MSAARIGDSRRAALLAAAARFESAADILEFERQWPDWRAPRRPEVIYQTFGVSVTRYMQRLHTILMHPASLALDPQTVHSRLERFAAAGDKRAERAAAIRRGQ